MGCFTDHQGAEMPGKCQPATDKLDSTVFAAVQIQMLTSFDYLEWAFEDLFGSWVPASQRFCPAFPHQFPEYRDPMFDRSSLIARLLNRAYEHVEDTILDGTAVCWCASCLHACSIQEV